MTSSPATPTAFLLQRLPGIALLVVLTLLAIWRVSVGTRLDSFTLDEAWHIAAGVAYQRGGDMHLNPEHPPLVKRWVGAWMPADVRLGEEPVLTEKEQERQWVEQQIYLENDSARVQARARLAMFAFHGVLLLVLGLLLWRAAGLAWAAGTLAFVALEPTLGAHVPVVMTDGPLAFTLIPAAVAGALLCATWQWRWSLLLGLLTGLALTAKHSALAGLAGLGLLLLGAALWGLRRGGVREVLRRGLHLLVSGVLALTILWALYGFRYHADHDGSDPFNRSLEQKIEEVHSPLLKASLELADRSHLLPRAYLWGLADTVRTGVQGRAIMRHLIWGREYEGRTPWFTWPAIIAAKLPLALSALALLGLALVLRERQLPPSTRWMLAALTAISATHLAALMVSPAAWGGIRHATPLLLVIAICGGAAAALAWRRRSRVIAALAGILYVAALAMTITAPRLWEYANEMAGGSHEAWRYFKNEGIDLGQRFNEIRDFYRERIEPSGEPFYVDYWMAIPEQWEAAGVQRVRRVETLDDSNTEGHYAGWFMCANSARLPVPQQDWNPDEVFRDLTLVAELGEIGIWHGSQTDPKLRADAMTGRVRRYLYTEAGDDWAKVAQRLAEVVAVLPRDGFAWLELGNARLRLGDFDGAEQAWRDMLSQKGDQLDPALQQEIRGHIEALEKGGQPELVKPIRNPWLE
ncbi:MAG: hypothetical protein R3F22_03655 [Lysobacteraceae bacterium]